jgi:uncharacterized MAPEG superfamily protein
MRRPLGSRVRARRLLLSAIDERRVPRSEDTGSSAMWADRLATRSADSAQAGDMLAVKMFVAAVIIIVVAGVAAGLTIVLSLH